MSRETLISRLREIVNNPELSVDQRRKLEAVITELKEEPQGQDATEAFFNAVTRIAFWLLLDDLI